MAGDIHANTLDMLFGRKTPTRLEEFCQSRNIELSSSWIFQGHETSLNEILTNSEKHLPDAQKALGVLHGDFCFSNILYDFRSSKIKTIDPRGMTPDGHQTIYGDICYDIAKLSHSVLGLYDWIVAGYYEVSIKNNKIKLEIADGGLHRETQQVFVELVEERVWYYGTKSICDADPTFPFYAATSFR